MFQEAVRSCCCLKTHIGCMFPLAINIKILLTVNYLYPLPAAILVVLVFSDWFVSPRLCLHVHTAQKLFLNCYKIYRFLYMDADVAYFS